MKGGSATMDNVYELSVVANSSTALFYLEAVDGGDGACELKRSRET